MKLSASQVSKYRQCQRLIGFSYVEGIKEPSSIKQQFGTAVHAELEQWLKFATMPANTPEGKTAQQGLAHLPAPVADLYIEVPISIDWFPGVRMIGFADCVDSKNRLIIDHKTTSHLRWAKTSEQLTADCQAIIYALWVMINWKVSSVRARWVYYSATNPKKSPRKPNGSKFVEVIFRADDPEFLRHVRQLLVDTRAIVNIREQAQKGLSLPPSPESCGMFGGCYFKDTCSLPAGDSLEAYIEQDRRLNDK